MKLRVPNVKGYTYNYLEYSILKPLEYLSVTICGTAPELVTEIPDRVERNKIYEVGFLSPCHHSCEFFTCHHLKVNRI